MTTASHTGQYRDTATGVLQRRDGAAWQNYQPPGEVETTASGVTVAADFSLISFSARRTNGVCSFALYLTRTGTDIAATSAGSIADTTLATLPAGWRPAINVECVASDGYGSGACLVTAAGTLTLRTWSANAVLAVGHNVHITATYVL